jgi:hypothetical protein
LRLELLDEFELELRDEFELELLEEFELELREEFELELLEEFELELPAATATGRESLLAACAAAAGAAATATTSPVAPSERTYVFKGMVHLLEGSRMTRPTVPGLDETRMR